MMMSNSSYNLFSKRKYCILCIGAIKIYNQISICILFIYFNNKIFFSYGIRGQEPRGH